MNVMEAIKKLQEYDDKIEALDLALNKIDSSYEREILKEIKSDISDERKQLQNRLEKTKLVNVR